MSTIRTQVFIAGAFASALAFAVAFALHSNAVAYGTAFSAFAFSAAGIFHAWRTMDD